MFARSPRSTRVAIVTFALLAGCGSDDQSGASVPSQDAGSDVSSTTGWGNGACGTCVKSSCQQAVDACEVEPSCAAYLMCLYECDTTADGNADPACVAACPAATGTGIAPQEAFETCRTSGDGAQCATCGSVSDAGIDSAQHVNPIVAQTCPTSSETNVCWKCEDEKCCDTYTTCKANPACDQFRDCVRDCTDSMDVCTSECAQQVPDGYDDFRIRMACVNIMCMTECGESTDPCADCMADKCTNEMADCYEDAACDLLSLCMGACGDEACFNACRATYPGGEELNSTMLTCATKKCPTHCG